MEKEVLKKFKFFSEERGYHYDKNYSVLIDRTDLLFVISGGVRFDDELLGKVKSLYEKRANVQRCVRMNSLKNVGKTGRHHICFDMIGHFHFFEKERMMQKKEAIGFAYCFLVSTLKISSKKIFLRYHPDDLESKSICESLTANLESDFELVYYSKDNSHAAYRIELTIKQSDDTMKELWNIVMYDFASPRIGDNLLPSISIDSGASLDRIVTVLEGGDSNYQNSSWKGLITKLKIILNTENDEFINLTADMLKAILILDENGVEPGNKKERYVMKKLLKSFLIRCELDEKKIEDAIILGATHFDIKMNKLQSYVSNFNKSLQTNAKSNIKKIDKKYRSTEIDFEKVFDTYGLDKDLYNFFKKKMG